MASCNLLQQCPGTKLSSASEVINARFFQPTPSDTFGLPPPFPVTIRKVYRLRFPILTMVHNPGDEQASWGPGGIVLLDTHWYTESCQPNSCQHLPQALDFVVEKQLDCHLFCCLVCPLKACWERKIETHWPVFLPIPKIAKNTCQAESNSDWPKNQCSLGLMKL